MALFTKFKQQKPCKHCKGTTRYSSGHCVGCNATRKAKYRENPIAKARHAEFSERYDRTPMGRAKKITNHARMRAAKDGREFTISPFDVEIRVMGGFCEATGIPFQFSPPPLGCRVNPWAPSIDRIDNSRGYTPDNIQLVCNIFNIAKNDFSNDHILTMANALVKRYR